MRETISKPPADVTSGAELTEALRVILNRDDSESVRHVVRDRLKRTEPWVQHAFRHRKMLSEAIVLLSRSKELPQLIRHLDRADRTAERVFARQNPDLESRAGRTADRLRTFVAESGTPSAKRVFARALRDAEAVSGEEAARQVVEHLTRKRPLAATQVVERLIDRVSGQPEADEVTALRKELDAFIDGVVLAEKAQPLARALRQHARDTARRLNRLTLYDLATQLKDLMARYASDAASVRWGQAMAAEGPGGRDVARDLAQLLPRDSTAALEVLREDVLTPLDDRFGAVTDAAIKRLDDLVALLAEKKVLTDVLRAAHEADTAFQRSHEHLIFVGALPRFQAAVDRVGNDKTKRAFARAAEALIAEATPPGQPGAPGSSA